MSLQLLGSQHEGEAAHTNSIIMVLHLNTFFLTSFLNRYIMLKVVLPNRCLKQSSPLLMMAVVTVKGYWVVLYI